MSQPPPNPSSSSSAPQFQTDARFRTSLPTASLKSSITVPKLVDAEVESLAEGMADLVGIASVSSGRLERGVKIINEILKIEGKDRFQIAQEAFQAECKAESMAIAANSLLSITHSLKLMFLLGDEEYITQRRQERLKTAVADITAAKARFEKPGMD
ncbi:Surfeit locus protein 5 subunit 22 of Mediator complex [Rhizoctonia solani]|uniref:Surfeit locus protein 5 subunit 22 of Mediator complex n=1 Tax=Rhizoctonia solani TaxID=456999 RepID=A0A8H7M395_9AGAM|nr:Surfeit locus protein 5 subunit 22 of Mediator complex [Rhizoctonia solani]